MEQGVRFAIGNLRPRIDRMQVVLISRSPQQRAQIAAYGSLYQRGAPGLSGNRIGRPNDLARKTDGCLRLLFPAAQQPFELSCRLARDRSSHRRNGSIKDTTYQATTNPHLQATSTAMARMFASGAGRNTTGAAEALPSGISSGNIYAMKRTSLFLDAKILRDLKRAAQRERVSVASLVREAISRYLAEPTSGTRLPSVAGRFSSGASDTAGRTDELLWRDPHA